MLEKMTGRIRRCIEDYNMIEDGETIAVGVSGGKDSLTLLYALASLRKYYPKKFNLHVVTLSMGLEGMDFSPIGILCDKLDIPFTLKETDAGRIIFEYRQEKNPCSLCAKLRRGTLGTLLLELGIKKIALAHHYDDAVETFLMSLLYEGRFHCFQPVTYLDKTEITQIRPMLYVEEKSIIQFAEKENLSIVKNICSMNGESKREEIKTLIKTMSADYPDLKSKIFGSMKRLPLEGWG